MFGRLIATLSVCCVIALAQPAPAAAQGGKYHEAPSLDDQVKAEQFAGKKVKINGTLEAETHTLHVFDMEEDK